MEFFVKFFRGQEDGFIFKLFGFWHIFILGVFIIGLSLIIAKACGLSNRGTNNRFLKIMAWVLLIDQAILYAWQFGSGYFRLDMSLPFYHCRLIVWFLIIGILSDNDTFKALGMYLGLIGSLVSLVMADLYRFSFPHYTNFQFFIVHILMGWIAFDYIFVERLYISKDVLKKVLFTINGINIFLLVFNLILKPTYPEVNYGYMLGMPEGMGELFPKGIHTFAMILAFNLVILGLYKLINAKNKPIANGLTTKL